MDPVVTPTTVVEPDPATAAINALNGEDTNTVEGDENLWGDIAQDLDAQDSTSDLDLNVEPVVTKPAVSTPASVEPPAPVEPPAAEPSQEVTPPADVATQQPATPVVTPPEPVVPPVPEKSPEELKAERQQLRAQTIEHLAGAYQLSEEDATQFLTDPASVVPKFRAEMFLDIFDSVMGSLMQALPQLINQTNQTNQKQQEHEKAFYAANPLLDMANAQHVSTVNRLAHAYVTAVPGATVEQLIKDVGIQAMYTLGIDPNLAKPPATTPPATETPPAPYIPAGAGQIAAPGSVSSPQDNLWGEIARQMDEDED